MSSTVYRFLPSSKSPSAAPRQVLDEFVRFVDKTELMPDANNWAGGFDMIPVEQVVGWLSGSVLLGQYPADGDKAVGTSRFMHHESPVPVDLDELVAYLERHRGARGLQRISVHQWMGRVKALGFEYFITTQDPIVGGCGRPRDREA